MVGISRQVFITFFNFILSFSAVVFVRSFFVITVWPRDWAIFVFLVAVLLHVGYLIFNRTHYNTWGAVKQHLLSVMFGLNTALISATTIVVSFWLINKSNFAEVVFCWAGLEVVRGRWPATQLVQLTRDYITAGYGAQIADAIDYRLLTLKADGDLRVMKKLAESQASALSSDRSWVVSTVATFFGRTDIFTWSAGSKFFVTSAAITVGGIVLVYVLNKVVTSGLNFVGGKLWEFYKKPLAEGTVTEVQARVVQTQTGANVVRETPEVTTGVQRQLAAMETELTTHATRLDSHQDALVGQNQTLEELMHNQNTLAASNLTQEAQLKDLLAAQTNADSLLQQALFFSKLSSKGLETHRFLFANLLQSLMTLCGQDVSAEDIREARAKLIELRGALKVFFKNLSLARFAASASLTSNTAVGELLDAAKKVSEQNEL